MILYAPKIYCSSSHSPREVAPAISKPSLDNLNVISNDGADSDCFVVAKGAGINKKRNVLGSEPGKNTGRGFPLHSAIKPMVTFIILWPLERRIGTIAFKIQPAQKLQIFIDF